jgi:hypothetical protein
VSFPNDSILDFDSTHPSAIINLIQYMHNIRKLKKKKLTHILNPEELAQQKLF